MYVVVVVVVMVEDGVSQESPPRVLDGVRHLRAQLKPLIHLPSFHTVARTETKADKEYEVKNGKTLS